MRILFEAPSAATHINKSIEALRTGLRHACDCRMYGPGYDGFDPRVETYSQVVAAAFPDAAPQLIVTAFDLSQTRDAGALPYRGLEDVLTPKAAFISEPWKLSAAHAAEIRRAVRALGITYLVSPYPDVEGYVEGHSLGARILWIPPTFDAREFNDWKSTVQYDVGFLAGGTVEPSADCPERHRIHRRLLGRSDLRYLWAPHPGLTAGHSVHPLVGKPFSELMGSCLMFVATGGVHGLAHSKYFEALASRTLLLATEVPRGSDLGLVDGENYVAITEENVEEKIAYYLAHPEEARTIAARGFELAQRLHNCHARAVQFLESLEGTPFSVHAHRRSRQLRYLPEVYSPLKGLKLHLGCGGDYRSGWINVDRDPGARADIHAPIEDLDKYFAPSSAREALAVHALNYLRLWEARAFFRSMHRILEPGGKLVLETVNLERAIEKISQSKENFPEYLEGVRALHAFGLDHLEANEPYYPNSFSWTPWHLERELQLAGFSKIEFLPPTMHGQWRDMRVEATNSAPLVTRQSHVRSDDDPSVLFLFDSAMGQATAHTRAMRFQGHFERAGWRTGFLDFHKSGPEAAIAAAKSFDIVYLLKIASLSVVDRIRRETSARIVFDLTDALWAPLHRQHGWADLEGVLLRCDAVFSENQYVCEYASRYCDTVISLPVPTLVEDFEIARRERSSAPRSDVIVGWVGSSGTVAALTKIRPALAKVFRAHPECVLRVVGCHRQYLPDFPDMRVSVLESYNEEVMVREMLDLDIGLFPPPFDDDDFAIRGSQKALLYMAGGVATIAQRGGDCERFIEDGVTGMLATTESEWAEKLEQLVRDRSLRERLGDAARQSASVGRSTQAIFECLCDAFRRVAAK